MAHALMDYDDPCKQIHGHSYKLSVTVRGIPHHMPGSATDGMVMDYKQLHQIVKTQVMDKYDHRLLLNDGIPVEQFVKLREFFPEVVFLPYQPTCENLVIAWATLIQYKLPKRVELYNLCLYETENNYAEYCVSDNRGGL